MDSRCLYLARRYEIASVSWARVATPYIISLWIIVAGIVKICKSMVIAYCLIIGLFVPFNFIYI